MDKSINRKLLSDTITFMFVNGIISEPYYGYFVKDQNLPDKFYQIYTNKNGEAKDKNSLKRLGVTSIYAGLLSAYHQEVFNKPIEDCGQREIDYLITLYEKDDIIEFGNTFIQQIGWGAFTTREKKTKMFSILSEFIIDKYCAQYKDIKKSPVDNLAYFMFNIGITITNCGAVKEATDFKKGK